MVRNSAFSYKIDYITIFLEILNHEGHQNRITGQRVTAILLNGWIFPIEQNGEASRWRVCYQRGLPRLVLFNKFKDLFGFPNNWYTFLVVETKTQSSNFSKLLNSRLKCALFIAVFFVVQLLISLKNILPKVAGIYAKVSAAGFDPNRWWIFR